MTRAAIVAVIAATYLTALFLPVVNLVLDENRPPGIYYRGLDALQMGWTSIAIIPQLANVALAIGLLAMLLRKHKLAKLMGLSGFLLALTAPYVFGVLVTELRIAYYLWLLCPAILFGSAVLLLRAGSYHAVEQSI